MKPEHDAFGRELLDFVSGTNRCEIIERDDGYLDVNDDLVVYFEPFENWPEHHREAMKYVRGRVLDVGCGAGRHALHLQRSGLQVTGIDISPLAVRVCRMRGLEDARVLSIGQLSRRTGVFDTVILLANNFGLFGDPDRAKRLLEKFRNMTSADATILAESTDPYAGAGPVHRAYHQRNRARGRLGGQVRVRLRYRQYKTPWFDYLLVSKKEMKKIVAGTGWRIDSFVESDDAIYIGVLKKDNSEEK